MSGAASRSGIDRERLTIAPLDEKALGEFTNFSCDDVDLDDFIRADATRLQSLKVALTYVAWYEGKPRGYAALMADAVVLKPNERRKIRDTLGQSLAFADHPVVPALKVARIAVDRSFRERYRGVGEALVRFAFLTGLDFSDLCGCRLLTLDAYPESMGFYEGLGFVRNLDKTYAERNHPSMRLDLFAPVPPTWL